MIKTKYERGETSLVDITEHLQAEIDVLRGKDCLVDGDGPCCCCVKCLRWKIQQQHEQIACLTALLESGYVGE